MKYGIDLLIILIEIALSLYLKISYNLQDLGQTQEIVVVLFGAIITHIERSINFH